MSVGLEIKSIQQYLVCCYTANLFTAKTAGFHCVRFPTVISLYFLQSLSACIGSLQLSWRVSKACIFWSLMTAVSAVTFLLSLQSTTWIFAAQQLHFLKSDISDFCWLTPACTTNESKWILQAIPALYAVKQNVIINDKKWLFWHIINLILY